MEISSFSLLNQEENPHFYSCNHMDGFGTDNLNDNNNMHVTSDESNKKRRRENEENSRKVDKDSNESDPMKAGGGWMDILTSLLLLDEEEKREGEADACEAQKERLLFEDNFRQKERAMSGCYSQFQDHFGEVEQLRIKRRRDSTAAVVGAAEVVAGEENVGSGVFGQSSGGGQVSGQGQGQRRLWVKDRSTDWWDKFNSVDFPEDEFRKAFRMSRSTFDMICDELESVVVKKNTMLRDAIPVKQRVAVCIWRLATGEPLRLVSKRFGLGISTCHKLILEVCSAIRAVLMPKFLQWPEENRMRSVKAEFEAMSGVGNVGGAMYTTHVPIIAPKISVSAYFNKRHTERNQRTSYSITVQGVVDHKGVFTDVCIGWPGSMPDDQVLEKSALFHRANRGLLKDVWVAGSKGHPLMDWVLVPYAHPNLTWAQHAFNEKIEEIQKVAKDAFARLKGRWTCLQKRTEVKLQDLPIVLGACCVLHNICEMRNEGIDPELSYDIYDDEMTSENGMRSLAASQARDKIAHKLLHHGLAGTSV